MIAANYTVLNTLFDNNSELLSHEVDFVGVVTDTRKDCDGALFIALTGENFDGHNYVKAAYDKGAAIALVSNKVDCDIPQILVEDTLIAYGVIANYWRHQTNPKVIAITGSNGKTTVKEMLACILTLDHKVLATVGNLNNEIGVPQTLCELSHDDEIAIIEMGANHADEIRRLSQIAEPNVVYVNNASATHIEGFGSLEGVRKAKGELYQYAHHDTIALINGDDEAAKQWIEQSATRHIVTLSMANKEADINGLFKGEQLHIQSANNSFSLTLKVKGQHNHSNALAAIGLALAVNTSIDSIINALSQFNGFKGRLQFIEGVNGSTVIDDTYNANPTSFKAGINVLCDLPGEAWLAMGDMAELGEDAQQEHDNVVSFAQHAGVTALFTKGVMSNEAAKVMLDKACTYDSFEVMSDAIRARLNKNINLLVKGSRNAHMEDLVHLLKREAS